jgi:glycopeptide antibiotics resistance protein
MSMVSRRHPLAVLTSIAYGLGVVAVTVFPIRAHPRGLRAPWWVVIHWVPFAVPPIGFVLNVVMFVPLGVLAPLLWAGAASMRRMFALALGASAVIETTQLVLWLTLGNFRTVDINDLIANTAGGVLGLVLLRYVTRDRAAVHDDFQARM